MNFDFGFTFVTSSPYLVSNPGRDVYYQFPHGGRDVYDQLPHGGRDVYDQLPHGGRDVYDQLQNTGHVTSMTKHEQDHFPDVPVHWT